MVEEVTLREIQAVLEVTDRLGISREDLVIPLRPRHPGGVRRLSNGRIEIVVESEGDLDRFLAGLPERIHEVISG